MATFFVELLNGDQLLVHEDVFTVSTTPTLIDGLTEEGAPAAGDFLFGRTAEGNLRKFDVGDLPTGSGMASFNLTGDSGTPETVVNGNTVDVAGGTGIDTTVGATDTVTVAIDSTVATLTGSVTLTNKTLGTGTVISVAPTINDGITITCNPDATNSGLNVGAHTAEPSSPNNADIFYDSTANELKGYINGSWTNLAAGGFTSFTAAGDSGGGQAIADGNTLTIAGGTNITTADSATDTVTINLDASPVLTTPQINDTSADHQYIFAVSELIADRTVTLPLLTGNDTFTFNAFAATLTNKTIDSDNNTITNIVDADIKAAAAIDATKIADGTVTDAEFQYIGGLTSDAQAQIDTKITGSSPVLTTPQINDTSSDHQYIFAVSELIADRTVTLPLLTGNDTFTFNAFAATLTNKTIDSDNNTITNIVDADIKAAAAIDATKIADGTVTSAEFQYIGGLTSDAQTQIDAKGPGDVSKVGTPVDSQIGVWTGDGTIEGTADFTFDGADLLFYNAVNDGNPEIRLGATDLEEAHIQSVFDTGAQTLDYVLFQTDAASATADKGLYKFNVDGTDILDIDDGGINFAASKGISIAGADIITDSGGTATLSNIDALDATTEATIEAAIDTLSNLTAATSLVTVGTVTTGNVDAVVSAASTTTAGKAELATTAEIETGTDTGRVIGVDEFTASHYATDYVQVHCFDDATDCAVGDAAGDIFFTIPDKLDGWNLVYVLTAVATAGTTGTMDVQIHNIDNALDMLTTKCTIDTTETSSATAATAFSVNASNDHVHEGDRIRIDVDAIHTTAAKGLEVTLGFRLP